jgi:hypothetical protein
MGGVSTRTVKTHLKVLRETGLIEKTKHSRILGQADERLDASPPAAGATPSAPAEAVDNIVDCAVENPSSEVVTADSAYRSAWP